MLPHSTTRTIRAALFALSLLTLTACRPGASPTPTPARVIELPMPTATPDPEEAEDAFAEPFREALDLYQSASNAHGNLARQLDRDPALINDAAWRSSVTNEIDLFRRAIAMTNVAQPPPAFIPANDALITTSATFASILPILESALAENSVDAYLSVEDTIDQGDSQRRVASTFFFAER